MKDVYQLYVASIILILSSVVEPLLGNQPDSGGIGLAGILICSYLIIKDRDEEKKQNEIENQTDKENS
jgi:FtsH-binding integral membrane protein